MKSVSKHELVKQLSICGQLIERKSKHLQDINVDESKLVACFTPSQQETLLTMLKELQSYWIEAHKQAHKK